MILKGIFGDFSKDDIKKELLEHRLPKTNILKVTKIPYNKDISDEYSFIIQLSYDSKIKYIINVVTFRCVKCAGNYEPGKYPIANGNNTLPLKCANYDENGYSAS